MCISWLKAWFDADEFFGTSLIPGNQFFFENFTNLGLYSLSNLDSVITRIAKFNVLHISESWSKRLSAVIEFILKWQILKLFVGIGDPFERSKWKDLHSSSKSDKLLTSLTILQTSDKVSSFTGC